MRIKIAKFWKGKKSLRTYDTWFLKLTVSYGNQDSVGSALGQTYREYGNRSTQIWSIDFQQRFQGCSVGKGYSSKNSAGRTGPPYAKILTLPLPYTLYKS